MGCLLLNSIHWRTPDIQKKHEPQKVAKLAPYCVKTPQQLGWITLGRAKTAYNMNPTPPRKLREDIHQPMQSKAGRTQDPEASAMVANPKYIKPTQGII